MCNAYTVEWISLFVAGYVGDIFSTAINVIIVADYTERQVKTYTEPTTETAQLQPELTKPDDCNITDLLQLLTDIPCKMNSSMLIWHQQSEMGSLLSENQCRL